MQDFTGVPAVADLAAMREATVAVGGDAASIDPLFLSIWSSTIRSWSIISATPDALQKMSNTNSSATANATNSWMGQKAFDNFRVVPPGTGICHQVNLEYLAQVVWTEKTRAANGRLSRHLLWYHRHTTMVNGLAVLGRGVGGIEAEAAMLASPSRF